MVFGPYAVDSSPPDELTTIDYTTLAARIVPSRIEHAMAEPFRPTSFRVGVPIDPNVPVELHVMFLFRAQFEFLATADPIRKEHVRLLPFNFPKLLVRSPVRCDVRPGPERLHRLSHYFYPPGGGRQFKAGFLMAAWAAASNIAADWHRQLVQFNELGGRRAEDDWRTGLSKWAALLGRWRFEECPVGTVFIRSPGDGNPQVYFFVA